MSLLPFLHRAVDRHDLSMAEARDAMHAILSGAATPAQIGAFLVALRMKGETGDELAGFAGAMRDMAEPIHAGVNGTLLDTCGTGGDGGRTFNISTIAAFVVAGAGVRVAKHGNRSLSNQCGSADLMEALGVRMPIPAVESARALREIGIAFLFAPSIHTAMKHAQPVRLDLKMRTVFNLLGPLTNPAGATAQLVGAPSERAAELMAQALAALGLPRGMVVHGSDGLDEITTTGSTLAFEVREGAVTQHTLQPADFGVPAASLEQLTGGGKEFNAGLAREILDGAPGARRDIVVVNAAAALVVAGLAPDFAAGARLAADSIDSGAARRKVEQLAAFTQGVANR